MIIPAFIMHKYIREGAMPRAKRPDHDSVHRSQFESNKRKIFATRTLCGICGKPVDFTKHFPDPLSPCIDHIIPVDKGGHPSDMDNLQLAHLCCNRQKSDKILRSNRKDFGNEKDAISNRLLPLSMDWSKYKPYT